MTEDAILSADDVIITDQLAERPARAPDHALESRMFEALADELAERPGNLLQRMTDLLVEEGVAHSAGISIDDASESDRRFRWVALSGLWGQFRDGTMPFDASPCGVVILRDQMLLFESPERFFPDARVEPLIREILLMPFHAHGRPVGTLWINAHDEARKFDHEDARLLRRLARFASAGRQMNEARTGRDELERRVAAQTAALRESEERQTFLLSLSDALRPLGDPHEIKAVASRMLGERLGVDRVAYAELLPDGENMVTEGGWLRDGVPSIAGVYRVVEFGRFFRDIEAGSIATIADALADPELPSGTYESTFGLLNIRAAIAYPVMKGGRLVAALYIHSIEPRRWTKDEVSLVADVGERTWDAVERARAETALRESEERFRSFAETSTDTLWIIDAETGRLEYLSPAYEAMWGEPRDAVMASLGHWATRVHPDDRRKAAENLPRIRAGERVMAEYRVIRPDGTMRYIHDTGFPIFADGRVRRLGGVAQDLTERRLAERAVEESERRARTLMEGVPQLVWRGVDTGVWTWASPQWTEYTGQPERDTHGKGWLKHLHPDDRDAAMAAWERAEETGGFDIEYRIRRADGAYFWFSTRATPVRDEAGAIVEWLGTSTDIDALRQMQERQNVLVAELQHRTRNLIGVIRSLADKTADGASSLDEFEERFGLRLSALSRVQGLLSHLTAGRRVTFDELIRSELTALGALDGHADRVTLDGPGGVPLRSATVQTFALALHELATNAVKYGALANETGRLAVRWRVERPERGSPRLHVDWRESGVNMPHVDEPPRGGGYGRELIERALPYQLGASTSFELGPDGVHCTIAVPIASAGMAAES